MSDEKFLEQDEVDALLKAAQNEGESQSQGLDKDIPGLETGPESIAVPAEEPAAPDSFTAAPGEPLTTTEIDALGEIGNICMGSAATTLSQLLNKRVIITSPAVNTANKTDFLTAFNMPYLVIKIKFKAGFDGYNVLIIKQQDAILMANLMMGGDGTDLPEEISEMEISAASEAMNQMMGTASTSLADLLNKNINIAPPETELVQDLTNVQVDLPFNDPIVVISFKMDIENLLNTNIMQVIDLDNAREQSKLLWQSFGGSDSDMQVDATGENMSIDSAEPDLTAGLPENIPDPQPEDTFFEAKTPAAELQEKMGNLPQPLDQAPGNGHYPMPQVDQNKLNLLLDIPLKVSVVLGRTRKQIKDVLQMTPGAIVELETVVGEPVEILVNGKLVARGEVVVVNENFGVKISNIISTRDRINTINSSNLI